MRITNRQKEYIKDIEKNLNVVYTGNNRDDADLFIKTYKEENKQYNIDHKIPNFATYKQLQYIKDIEKVNKVKFEGKTFKEASDFIQQNCLREI